MQVKTGRDIIQSYFEDYSGLTGGYADAVYLPESTEEVADFLKHVSSRGLPVMISGGGTGVTGGRVPFGGVTVSLELLNSISGVTPRTGNTAVLTAGAGALVRDVKAAAHGAGYFYPPDPTEKGSSIGGNIATNASGSRGFAFGPTRNYVQRIIVVLSNGEILNIRRGEIFAGPDGSLSLPSRAIPVVTLPKYILPSIKNAAGYYNRPGADLIDVFIGHEGTLGIVTEADLKLIPRLGNIMGGVAFFPSTDIAIDFVDAVRDLSLSESKLFVLAIEYFDGNALRLLREDYPNIPGRARAAVIFEQELRTTGGAAMERWAELLERHGVALEDVWFSSTERELEAFREFRHRMPEKVNHIVKMNGLPKVGTDIAVPREHFREMYRFYEAEFDKSGLDWLIFGHIGECHLHANILPRTRDEYEQSRRVYLNLVKQAISLGGTVSAEHGIGKLKHAFLEQMIGVEGMKELSRFKHSIDNSGILSPGNMFPAAGR